MMKQQQYQQKDILQPQEDIVKYREAEYNIVINSMDRDWLQNTRENRYNFRTMFNAKQSGSGTVGLQPSVLTRIRNIVRLEFIKTIVPVEALSVIVPRDCSGNHLVTTACSSILDLPSVSIIIDEFHGNNYGTNEDIDKAFAVCQFDSVWRSEFHNYANMNRGHALFIPKSMKTHRIFTPAPLANLTTLTFRFQDPENKLLSDLPDSSVVTRFVFGSHKDVSGSCYSDLSDNLLSPNVSEVQNEYIFIKTQSWFPVWSYSMMDKLSFKGLAFQGASFTGSDAMIDWLQNNQHAVVGTAYDFTDLDVSGNVRDNSNASGYANWIIIRNRFADPTTGSTDINWFGTNNSSPPTNFVNNVASTPIITGGVLNLNRQVQIYMRVVTREYDLTTNVRSDNV